MGLYDEITEGIKDAFDNDLSDAVSKFTGERRVTGEYDPETGNVEESNIYYKGRGVFGSYSLNNIDGTLVLQNDKKLIALQSEVIDTPMIGDLINGMVVVSIKQDPANVSWVIQLRS